MFLVVRRRDRAIYMQQRALWMHVGAGKWEVTPFLRALLSIDRQGSSLSPEYSYSHLLQLGVCTDNARIQLSDCLRGVAWGRRSGAVGDGATGRILHHREPRSHSSQLSYSVMSAR